MTPESNFKRKLIKQIQLEYPGAIVLKNDANFMPGIPDHLILWGPRWAAFEAKAYEKAEHQPNQDYYVGLMNEMSYASFVYPQNKEKFLHELQQALRPGRSARISFRV